MMFGNRIARSMAIARESYSILKANPSLGLLPFVSGVSTFVASIPFLAVLALTGMGRAHHSQPSALHYAVIGAMYFVNMLIVVFFNSALVACANESLQGRPTTISFGVRQAVSRLPQIFCWAFIAASVGMILRIISERSNFVGSIISSVFGLAWNLAVFFVVPILVLERVSPIDAIKSSGKLLRQTWGDQVILGFGLSALFGLLAVLVVIPITLAIMLFANHLFPLGIFLIIASVMYILVVAIVGSALGTIYQTALYLYCRNGMIPSGFAASSMQDAFRPKPASKLFQRF